MDHFVALAFHKKVIVLIGYFISHTCIFKICNEVLIQFVNSAEKISHIPLVIAIC